MVLCILESTENIVGKGENAGYQHFLLFPQCFQKFSFPSLKFGISGLRLKLILQGNSCTKESKLADKPITRQQLLDYSKLKEFADDNFKFDENGRKLSKWVENIVGKGEIARYEQFLLFSQCFQRLISQGHQKVSLCGNELKDPI